MVEATTHQNAEPALPGIKPRPTPMAMCPMASMCKSVMEKPYSALLLMLPGTAMIALGVLIFLEPRILLWLIATACILFGIMSFMMASFVRRLGIRIRNA